jgi:hypothetical protein
MKDNNITFSAYPYALLGINVSLTTSILLISMIHDIELEAMQLQKCSVLP